MALEVNLTWMNGLGLCSIERIEIMVAPKHCKFSRLSLTMLSGCRQFLQWLSPPEPKTARRLTMKINFSFSELSDCSLPHLPFSMPRHYRLDLTSPYFRYFNTIPVFFLKISLVGFWWWADGKQYIGAEWLNERSSLLMGSMFSYFIDCIMVFL